MDFISREQMIIILCKPLYTQNPHISFPFECSKFFQNVRYCVCHSGGAVKIKSAFILTVQFSSVEFSHSVVSDSATPWTATCQASLSITNSQTLPKVMSIELVMPSSHLILCHPLLLLPFNLSQHQGLFKSVSSLHQVAKVLEFQLQHQSFQWTFRTDLL